ncbi:MAG: hypothetical protein JNM27_21565 [Leptospirales bacterium]|nr:hypothetical protein [Leptospirales bacterium]
MSIEYKVRSFLWRKLRRLFTPGPARLVVETELPLRPGELESRLKRMIQPGPAGSLPNVLVEASEIGTFRSRVTMTARLPEIPGSRSLLSLLSPALRRAFRRKTNQLLLPNARAQRLPGGIYEALIVMPIRADSFHGQPFLNADSGESHKGRSTFYLQIHLTQTPVPFEENAAHFSLFEEVRVLTRTGMWRGFVQVPGTIQTTLLPGAGGNLYFEKKEIRVVLGDEKKDHRLETVFVLDRPFGLGDSLPAITRSPRNLFHFNDELDLIVEQQELTRAVNQIVMLESSAAAKTILPFLAQEFAIQDLEATGVSVFIPVLEITKLKAKTLPARSLVF